MKQPEDVEIYRAPNIREMALSTLHQRTEQRQNRRLIAAIETNRMKIAKTEGMQDKDLIKFSKLILSAEKRLDKIRDELEKVEREIGDATQLHSHITILGHNLGQ